AKLTWALVREDSKHSKIAEKVLDIQTHVSITQVNMSEMHKALVLPPKSSDGVKERVADTSGTKSRSISSKRAAEDRFEDHNAQNQDSLLPKRNRVEKSAVAAESVGYITELDVEEEIKIDVNEREKLEEQFLEFPKEKIEYDGINITD
ncbi:hypothetical protein HK098_007708, partial [Nowakowskiella sp. JEL0407]